MNVMQKSPSADKLPDESTEVNESVSFAFQSDFISQSDSSSSSSEYRTIDQNEFMMDCMINAKGCFFLHFFFEGSSRSNAIDKQMEDLASIYPDCRFLRIDVSLAPFVTSKLKICIKQSSVVVMKNGSFAGRIADFLSTDCSELREWAATRRLLNIQ